MRIEILRVVHGMKKKITAHHAIIPTTVACNVNSLTQAERNIYFLISQAYIAQFYGEHVYEQTRIVVGQCEEEFVANGRVVIEEGWKSLYKRQKSKTNADGDEPDLTDERGAESGPKRMLSKKQIICRRLKRMTQFNIRIHL